MSTTRDRLRARPLDMETKHARVYLEPEVVAFAESEARTAAANARREALEEVRNMAIACRDLSEQNGDLEIDMMRAFGNVVDFVNSIDSPATSAEPSTSSGQGILCPASAGLHGFGDRCLLPIGHQGMHAADGLWWPNGDAKEMCEHGRCGKSGWMVRDGRAVACTCVSADASHPAAETQTYHLCEHRGEPLDHPCEYGCNDAEIKRREALMRGEQPPARDVEGMAGFLGDYVREHTTMLNWRDFASAVFAFLDGGPRP